MTKTAKGLLGGVALGAGLVYAFDPQVGNRRLSLGRAKLFSVAKRSARFARGLSEDLSNRAFGLYAMARRFTGNPLPHQKRYSRRAS